MQLWVHRLSVSSGGEPAGAVEDRSFELHRVLREIRRPPLPLTDDRAGAREFLVRELMEHGRLRQGWGVPGLDLRKVSFHDNFVIAMRKYWNSIPQETIAALEGRDSWDDGELFGVLEAAYRDAEGRCKILRRMQQMSRGDVVFLPNVPDEGATFAVATIADTGYVFEERNPAGATRTWEYDFGHLRKVRDVRKFDYGSATLPASIFGAPYRHAIDKVNAKSAVFKEFISKHYQV